MAVSLDTAFDTLRKRAEAYGIRVRTEPLDPETAGKFDGLSITLNPEFDLETRCYFLVHSLGSIIQWSVDFEGSRAVFDALRAAEAVRNTDPERLTRALEGYRAFEEAASEYAVWILEESGLAGLIPSYTAYVRADLDAMLQFHRTGTAPVWSEFFPEWQEAVKRGEKQVEPYDPRPVPPFRPEKIPTQEVVQNDAPDA